MSLNYFSQENSLRNMVFYLIIVLKKKTVKDGKSIRMYDKIAEIDSD